MRIIFITLAILLTQVSCGSLGDISTWEHQPHDEDADPWFVDDSGMVDPYYGGGE